MHRPISQADGRCHAQCEGWYQSYEHKSHPPLVDDRASLLPHLKEAAHPDHHRDTVRCEYYRALNPIANERFNGTFGTMIRDKRYKLNVYHGHEIGELYDLEADPGEFENRWNDPAYAEIKMRLMKQSFDALALAVDTGPKQVTRF